MNYWLDRHGGGGKIKRSLFGIPIVANCMRVIATGMIAEEMIVGSNYLKAAIIAGLLAGNSLSASAADFFQSVAVTGSASPGNTTQVQYFMGANSHFIVLGVLPVVASVAANPASMNAAVNITSSPYLGSGDIYAAQWTIVAGATGVQVNPAFQANSPFNFFSANSGSVNLRCSVGNMSGSCIFVTRIIISGDPVF